MIPPILQSPSYRYPEGTIEPAFVHIQHSLRLTVNTEGMFANFHVRIPIMIGTEPGFDTNQQTTINPALVFRSTNGNQSILDENDDLPPDYDSVKNIK